MRMVQFIYPTNVKRSPLYWLNPRNIWAARQKYFRRDNAVAWRRAMEARYPNLSPARSVPFSTLLRTHGPLPATFRFLILGDTGEGDRSQYGTLPMIRTLAPSFIIINGDVAYPAGRNEDFTRGFFNPYKDLKIPIWATPGNHEYYSSLKGSEFFEVFCTHTRNREWLAAGLCQVPQPGTYFELKQPDFRVVVLGLDTGQAGDMDGQRSGTKDDWQHQWLKWRLDLAEKEKKSVIVLFHIPSLVDAKAQTKSVHLVELHRILAQYTCIRLIVCGHIHNFQAYTPATFQTFIQQQYTVTPKGSPHYWVVGGGGAYLESTDFKNPTYRLRSFPTAAQWNGYATEARKTLEKMGLLQNAIGRSGIKAAPFLDPDEPKYLSFISIEVTPKGIDAVSIEIPDAEETPYQVAPPPPNTTVDVMSSQTLISQKAIDAILAAGQRTPL